VTLSAKISDLKHLCLSKTSKRLSGPDYTSFIILSSDAHFSDDTPRLSVFDLPLARCSRTRELGPAPSNRRASKVRQKTPEIGLRDRLICLFLFVPPKCATARPGRRMQ
jgi:hypothetical protein